MDFFSGNAVWLLALATLVIVVVIAIWQRGVVAKAKTQHDHSAVTAGRPDQRKSDGAEPGTKAEGKRP